MEGARYEGLKSPSRMSLGSLRDYFSLSGMLAGFTGAGAGTTATLVYNTGKNFLTQQIPYLIQTNSVLNPVSLLNSAMNSLGAGWDGSKEGYLFGLGIGLLATKKFWDSVHYLAYGKRR
jgi:hypothetical protein